MQQDTGPESRREWLSLHLIPGLGSRSFEKLLERFGSPDAVFRAPLREIRSVKGLPGEVAERIAKKDWTTDPDEELRKLEHIQGRLVTFMDPGYPRSLRYIPSPPMVLYLRGKGLEQGQDRIAVVGSRSPTPYGLKTARRLARDLAAAGLGVVSGLALGVDAAGHEGALEAGGKTVAVLGTGVDVVYPWTNRRLFSRILEKGILISEFPLGTPPEPGNFPARNRIISGLSRGVVVVEAARRSGSLITASMALEQGREVFAVPGSVNTMKSAGCHFLLKNGAALAENAVDVLEALGLEGESGMRRDGEAGEAVPAAAMTETEERIWELLGDDPVHIDEITRSARLSAGEVLGILTKMELTGLIEQLPGKFFVRA
ncbi:MAG: DNA-processing protein DprA [Desulfobacteraceae bacterium]